MANQASNTQPPPPCPREPEPPSSIRREMKNDLGSRMRKKKGRGQRRNRLALGFVFWLTRFL
jgi:hypothetical protein